LRCNKRKQFCLPAPPNPIAGTGVEEDVALTNQGKECADHAPVFLLKESKVSILGNIMGKREPEVTYRTVDGGHPAPYPDMTDEQLYNYEVTFNVARRTFDKPPRPPRPMKKDDTTTVRREATQPPRPEKAFDAPRYTARREREAEPPPRDEAIKPEIRPHELPPLDFSKPMRLVTTGQPVDIITTRARHPIYKVHGYIGDDDVVTVFTLNGQLSENGLRYLENVPQRQQLYLNIYANPDPRTRDRYVLTQHETRDVADAEAKPGRIACVPVQFDT
jgi:hypothetical protein